MPETVPRLRAGIDSMTSDAPMPHSPPMAKPNKARNTRKTGSDGAKAEASSSPAKSRMSIMRIGCRPNFSASQPKKNAPKGRSMSVSAMATVTSVTCVWKSCAMAFNTKTIRKKSKASSVQPSTLAMNAAHCGRLSAARSSMILM